MDQIRRGGHQNVNDDEIYYETVNLLKSNEKIS